MKRLFFLLFVLPLAALRTFAATETVRGIVWTYTIVNGEVTIGGGFSYPAVPTSTTGDLTIPAFLGGCPVTSIRSFAFYGCSGLETVTIPLGVTSIGDDAFRYCTGLKTVMIPSSVTSIGECAFSDCSGLRTLTIPACVTRLSSTFPDYELIREVIICDGVASIGDFAFYGCSGLTSVTIPSSVTNIGDYAFNHCSGLETVTIPSGVTSIGNSAFYGCSGLTSFFVDKSNPAYSSRNGLLCTKDAKTLVCGVNGDVTIPSGVTSIGNSAFYRCSGLTSVTIPSSVTNIGDDAFYYCNGLTSVTIPPSVTNIGDDAFYYCNGLTSVTIPPSVTSIGEGAFSWCCGLTAVTIADGVTNIGRSAFYGCSGIEIVTIPSSVKGIGGYSFCGCSGLTSVTISSSETSIGSYAFYGCANICSVTVPGWKCGIDFSSVTDLVIAEGVTSIENWAFEDCNGLMSVTIPSSVTNVAITAFQGCENIEEVSLGNALFGEDKCTMAMLFPGSYTSIRSVELDEGFTEIGRSMFAGCASLEAFAVPPEVTRIGVDAFAGCDGIKRVDVASIDQWMTMEFENENANPLVEGAALYVNFEEMTALGIPEGTTEIGEHAFAGGQFTSVTIPNSVTNVAATAFAGCKNIVEVSLGSGLFGETKREVHICDEPEGDWPDIGDGQYRSKAIGNNGSTQVSVHLNLKEAQTCSFKWKVSSESNFDKLEYSVDGTKVADISGSRDWATKDVSLEAGEHTIVWRYYKDGSQSSGEDCGWVDLSELLALKAVLGEQVTLATLFPDSYGSIRSVRLDDGFTEIGRGMFAGCSSLEAFAVPPKVTRIGADAFLGGDAIKRVDVASVDQWMMMEFENENANPLVEGATLYVNGQPYGSGASVVDGLTILDGWVVCCEDPYVAEIAVPEGIVGIGRGALADLYDLEAVRLPSTLKYIASGAFARDSYLDEVEIPDSVVRIDADAFVDCSWMQTISVGRGVERVGSRAFAGCTKLARIRFEDGLTEIGDCAFSNCWRMMSASLPLSVTNVAATAFKDCDSLTGVNVPTSIAPLSQWFAPVYRQIKDVTIPSGEALVCSNMFKGCSALVSVDIPEGVTNIGGSAFEDCVNLPSVELPSSLESVGESAFRNCDALTAIGLPDAVCSVGAYAFYDCYRLKDVSLSKNLESLPDHVFDACPQLDSIYVPASVTQLGSHIFGGAMSAVYFIGNAPAYDADVYASTGSGLVTYVKYGTKGWDGRPNSRDLPQMWPTGNSYGRSIMTWDPVQFDVTFDAGEGVFHPVEAQTYACEQVMYTAYSLPPFNPVRKGYKFAGWWTEAIGGAEVTPSTGVKSDRPHTLYAHWDQSFIVTVRFNACGGTVLPNEIEYTAEVPFGTLPVPTREHYIFTGWYTAASGGSIVRVSTEVPKADRELFAHWSPAHYEIRFNANNGTGATATQGFIYGQDVTLRANGFSCSGCEFVGWSLTPGGEAVYADGKTISGLAAIEDGVIDLYAVWTGNVYAVRFDSHGGLGVMPNQTFVLGVPQKLSHCTFTRSGYVFKGWALSTTAEVSYGDGEEVCNLTASKNATVVLFAVWERDPQGEWTVAEYLNCTNLTFALGGDTPLWYGEKVARADKVGMMRSGAIGDSQTNWIETVVTGAGQIGFWWKASGEYQITKKVVMRYDYAEFIIDGVLVEEIGDESDWTYVTIPVEGTGSHILRWMYHKDESGSDGDDCAWLSEVSWEPTQVVEPIPELPENPTAEDVQSALAGSADSALLVHITDAATYNAYREWALKIGATDVKASPFAWASFATDSAALLAKMPTDDDLKVEEFKPSPTAGSFDFTVSVKDVTIGDRASVDNLKKLFGLEGAESLDAAAFSSENVSLDFREPQDGKLKFTATPAVDNAKSFFMKAKVK